MENLETKEVISRYSEVLEIPDLVQKAKEKTYTYFKPSFDNEFIKKDLLNLFLDAEKKNLNSINENNKSQLYGLIIGEASKKKKLYERLRMDLKGFNTRDFVNIISKILNQKRDLSSLLGTEARDFFDLGKLKISILSFGDFFAAMIYQSEFRSAGTSKLEARISDIFRKQNYLDASVVRNNILESLDKDVDQFIESLPVSKSLFETLLKLFFLIIFSAVTLNKVYEWDTRREVINDSYLEKLPIKIDRSLLLSTYFISGSIPDIGYKTYLRKKLNNNGIRNIRWNLVVQSYFIK